MYPLKGFRTLLGNGFGAATGVCDGLIGLVSCAGVSGTCGSGSPMLGFSTAGCLFSEGVGTGA